MVGCGEISGCAPLWRAARASCSSDCRCPGARTAPSSPCPPAREALTEPVGRVWSLFLVAVREVESRAGREWAAMVVGPGSGEGETMGGGTC